MRTTLLILSLLFINLGICQSHTCNYTGLLELTPHKYGGYNLFGSAYGVINDSYIYTISGLFDPSRNATGGESCTTKYSPITGEYEEKIAFPHKGFGVCAVNYKNSIYVSGGQDFEFEVSSVYKYNGGDGDYIPLKDMNKKRSLHACTVVKSNIFVCGGFQRGRIPTLTCERYHFDQDVWTMDVTSLDSIISKQFYIGGMAGYSNKVYLIGGVVNSTNSPSKNIYEYNLITKIWSLASFSLSTPRAYFSIVMNLDKIFIIGGSKTTPPESEMFEGMSIIDITNSNVIDINEPELGLAGMSAGVIDENRIYVFWGIQNYSQNFVNDKTYMFCLPKPEIVNTNSTTSMIYTNSITNYTINATISIESESKNQDGFRYFLIIIIIFIVVWILSCMSILFYKLLKKRKSTCYKKLNDKETELQ